MSEFTRRSILRSIAAAGAASTVGVAAGQQANESETATPTTTETGPENTVAAQVSEITHVAEYDYRGSEFHITFYSEEFTNATISESVISSTAGPGSFNIKRLRLNEGVTETTVPAAKSGDIAVVTITTTESIAQGTGTYLQAGVPGLQVFGGPATWGLAGLGAAGTFAGTAYGTRRYYRKKQDEQDAEEVDRIA
jgi:spermidine/putrescine-binding protein